MIEDPERYVPASPPHADLLLFIPEDARVAELGPALAAASGARALIAPRREASYIPPGLMRQLQETLKKNNIAGCFPMPFCSLTRTFSSSQIIREFANFFGQPRLSLEIDGGKIAGITVQCETPCGCTRFVAENLVGTPVKEAETQAALCHHYYPCWASAQPVRAVGDSLIHVAARITRHSVRKALAKL
jgi:hypothetical protein